MASPHNPTRPDTAGISITAENFHLHSKQQYPPLYIQPTYKFLPLFDTGFSKLSHETHPDSNQSFLGYKLKSNLKIGYKRQALKIKNSVTIM